jgi:hypothetical protein
MEKKKIYGYSLGEIVISKTDTFRESSDISRRYDLIPSGSRLRLVAFAPKVRKVKEPDGIKQDRKDYFFNAVLADSTDPDYKGRIRESFCTIRKLRKGE